MTEEIQMALDEAKDQMNKAMAHLEFELNKIRAGKAHPSMLDSVMVDYYGTMTPLKQVANVNTPDPRTITIQPWEKAMIDPISTGIINSNLGLNPQNNGEMIIVNVPALTEERRRDLSKKARSEGEHAKVGIRNARKEANDFIKSAEKDGLSEDFAKLAETKVQELTDQYVKKVDAVLDTKEAEIMTV
ncbi:MAG: ribosome recycling factor [Cryomorphaceae bacterium]|nr:ribosome recycling factor [Cryomorphaceae bacterium]